MNPLENFGIHYRVARGGVGGGKGEGEEVVKQNYSAEINVERRVLFKRVFHFHEDTATVRAYRNHTSLNEPDEAGKENSPRRVTRRIERDTCPKTQRVTR